jgi:chemotaxis protein MotA
MDIATILGIIGGVLLLSIAIFSKGSAGGFVDFPSILVVLGGTLAATLVMFPWGTVMGSFKVAMNAFKRKVLEPDVIIERMVEYANIARRESVIALDKLSIDEPFIAKGIRLVVDGSDPSTVRRVLETEISFMKNRHKRGQNVFKGMGMVAPAFGMIGTLIGLVIMLQTLDDPSSIGPSMAVALLTTLYGAILANLFFIPISKKLEERSNDEALVWELAMEGILAIQNGEHPAIIKEKLYAFLAPESRREEAQAQAQAEG